jgi:hypothetical protein
MKAKIEIEIKADDLETKYAHKISVKDMKDELRNMLFEIAEDWVLRNQEPDIDFKNEFKK